MKILALDIGGVCITLHMERALAALNIPDYNTASEQIRRAISGYNCGTVGSEEFCRIMQEQTGHVHSNDEIRRRWNLFLGETIPETTELVNALLDDGWRIAFLSDIQPWHADALPPLIPYLDRIKERIYSFEVGAEKPSPQMYKAFEEKVGRPDLYIDDRLNNIEGGCACGWNAIQYSPSVGARMLEIFRQSPDNFLKNIKDSL